MFCFQKDGLLLPSLRRRENPGVMGASPYSKPPKFVVPEHKVSADDPLCLAMFALLPLARRFRVSNCVVFGRARRDAPAAGVCSGESTRE